MWHELRGSYEYPLAMNRPFDIDACLDCHRHAPRFRAVPAHTDPEIAGAARLARDVLHRNVSPERTSARGAERLGGEAVIRLAGALILIGMIPVAHVVLDPTGATATRLIFFGTPCVAAGMLVYLAARFRPRGRPIERSRESRWLRVAPRWSGSR